MLGSIEAIQATGDRIKSSIRIGILIKDMMTAVSKLKTSILPMIIPKNKFKITAQVTVSNACDAIISPKTAVGLEASIFVIIDRLGYSVSCGFKPCPNLIPKSPMELIRGVLKD